MHIHMLFLQTTTILDVKKEVFKKRQDFPTYKQELYHQKRLLRDDSIVASCDGMKENSTLNLIVRVPTKLYINDPKGIVHEVEVPSNQPKV